MSRSRHSVFLSAMPPSVLANDNGNNSTDDIQIAIAPRIQAYLRKSGRRQSFCSVMLPIAFERAAANSWMDPKYDSPELEDQYQTSVFPQLRMRYRLALCYILLCCFVWFLYFLLEGGGSKEFWSLISCCFFLLSLITIMAWYFTQCEMYRAYYICISAITAVVLCASSLSFLTYTKTAFSPLGHFAICLEIILLIYTAMPMILWQSALIAITYSIVFEIITPMLVTNYAVHGSATAFSYKILIIRILSHISVHLVGLHMLIMNLVRMRGTFMKVGQNLLIRRQLEAKKQLKEKMIHSMMPSSIADMLLKEGNSIDGNTAVQLVNVESRYMRPRTSNEVKLLFRPFYMDSMENVSILFSDIVGFTRMSSTKTAEEIVKILNNLFERFDDLCIRNGCEKISTLGDCYYCVSGCPQPRSDHAICCVEMGLGMIDAMRSFTAQHHDYHDVKIRVGVHTGTVLCGIVGMRRVKFDVWSNDVSLASQMESSGKPKQVHISEETASFLDEAYYLVEGEKVSGHRTYFVWRREDVHCCECRNTSSGSCRSHCSCSSEQSETSLLPVQRASSLTTNQQPVELAIDGRNNVTLPLIETVTGSATSHQSPHSRNSSVLPDGLRISPSATSHKDSDIKSNSHRPSILQQIYALNQTTNMSTNHVAGYLTSSTSVISNVRVADSTYSANVSLRPPAASAGQLDDPLAANLQQLREQSDLQLIHCIRENAKSQRSYLVKPPLKRFSLYFKSHQMEIDFRSKAHRFGSENETEGPPTLATPHYNTYVDIFVGLIVYLCISISLFLMTRNTETTSFNLWVSLFTFFMAIQVLALFVFTRQLDRRNSKQVNSQVNDTESCAVRIFEAATNWYPWHIGLAILMAMPVILIITNFLLLDLNELEAFEYHYGFLIFVCIVHFCNFTQLNCWMRNILAFLAALCFVGIAVSQLYFNRSDAQAAAVLQNTTIFPATPREAIKHIIEEIKWFQDYHLEIYLDLFLILVLVFFLNREFEIGYRLTFYANAVANQDKNRIQYMKNQVDFLLHNIIPKHVVEHLKNNAKYSVNHHNVGIIFASIVNFDEMYDESFLGDKEYLRVLNELIGDFDELLSRPEFKAVEKIKTIGSTYMAASGLDPNHRGAGNEHIHSLMEFSIAMQGVLDAFNKDLLEFVLLLRIGFNVGNVAAGVIGTSKLYYDIWGDAVNVASRMDLTGVSNRIQVGKDCLQFLESKYEFESRGYVYVHGKDNMEVFLFTQRKTDFLSDDEAQQDEVRHLSMESQKTE